jgi:DnaJ-class molecular chaperone
VLTDAKKRRVYDRVLFGEKDHSQLGKQHPKQRGGKRVAEQDDGWRPFRPKVVI